jgi:hypothetical protein
MPRLQKCRLVFPHDPVDFTQLAAAETAAFCKSDGIDPKLGYMIVPFDVDMPRFVPIRRIEE